MTASYRDILKRELSTRQQINPRYSLRSFARDLAMPASKLSQTLSGKCGISPTRASRIAQRLRFSKEETAFFIDLVSAEHSRSPSIKRQALEKIADSNTKYSLLSLEEFQAISAWHNLAIIEMTHLADFKNDPQWIGQRLGISATQVKESIERLIKLGLLKRQGMKLIDTNLHLRVGNDVLSKVVQTFHIQIMNQAKKALISQPVEDREFASTLLAIDPLKLPEAKQALQEFRRKFCQNIQKGKSPKNKLYSLSMQFFEINEGVGNEI